MPAQPELVEGRSPLGREKAGANNFYCAALSWPFGPAPIRQAQGERIKNTKPGQGV